ncbi:hypothetical protein PILCRDRAFT_280 [Piloderma croceum F 1598]|uniref:Uncharacterized protein n=1 Tax=Piloderma croceum (strain F 1598) TaxID=765440 RepID=A0A0C3C038_PILCF|nr:hypothetical protein PILCRDRAFT_280 [Piloderma croceum F 1598]
MGVERDPRPSTTVLSLRAITHHGLYHTSAGLMGRVASKYTSNQESINGMNGNSK